MITAFLNSPWVSALGWSLLHSLWQGTVVAAVLLALLRVLRRNGLRHFAACLSMLLCLLLPIRTTLLEVQARSGSATMEKVSHTPAQEAKLRPIQPESQPSLQSRMERTLTRSTPFLAGLWILGCCFMGLRLSGGWLWTLRWRRRSQTATQEWIDTLNRIAASLRITRRVRLRISNAVDSPVTLGLWKPVILVPASLFTGIAPELLEALLAHELAHIRRQDYFVNWLQNCAEVLLFYHPAVWWISRQIRIEREILADGMAADALGDPRNLALALDALDDLQSPLSTLALAAHGGDLVKRIEHLLCPGRASRHSSRVFAWVAPIILTIALLTPLTAAVIQESKQDVQKIYVPEHLIGQIDALAKQEGIDPALLRAVAQVESHFDPKAVSTIGAMGILQVMPETARKFGAKNLDDPDQVATAGVRYLKSLLDRYTGDWSKAVAAYNAGEVGLETGKLRPETPTYTQEVLRLARAQAVQPSSLDPQIQTDKPTPFPPLHFAEAMARTVLPVAGELDTMPDGELLLSLKLRCIQGFKVEVLPEGETKTVCGIMSGDTDADPNDTNATPAESAPRVLFKNTGPSKRLRIRCTERAGMGRWGEATVDSTALPLFFAFALDHEPDKR